MATTAQLSGGSFADGVWQPAGPAGAGAPVALAADPWRPDHVYLATEAGVHVSRDEGLTWALSPLPGLVGFSTHPGEPGELFAVTAAEDGGLRLWRSEDRGAAWRPGATLGPITAEPGGRAAGVDLAPDPSQPGRLYVAALHTPGPGREGEPPVARLWISGDDGGTLRRLPLPTTPEHPAPPATATASTPGPPPALHLAVLGDGTLLVARGRALHRLPPDGAEWQPARHGLEVPAGDGTPRFREIRHLAVGGDDRRMLYAALAAGDGPANGARVYRSIDGGSGWSAYGTGLPAGPVTDLVPSRRGDDGARAVVAGAGVFTSLGDAWTEVSPGLPPPAEPALLAIAPGRRGVLWAATAAGELYRRAPPPPGCVEDAGTLCLAGRFRVEVVPFPGDTSAEVPPGPARAVPLTKDGGWFWFDDPENPEVVVRATTPPQPPGSPRAWTVYAASLSAEPFDLHVHDVETGVTESLRHRRGGGGDGTLVATFPAGDPGSGGGDHWFAALPEGGCGGESIDLCLHDGRFEVAVDWRDADGAAGAAVGDRLTGASGWFRFLHPGEPDLVVKIPDGRPTGSHRQVAFASVSELGFEQTVTDRRSGEAVVYEVAPGGPASHLDLTAFPEAPPEH